MATTPRQTVTRDMKVVYCLETFWPLDVPNPDEFRTMTWLRHGEIPFLPVVGMRIDAGDSELRRVASVEWSVGQFDVVNVSFDDDLRHNNLARWVQRGWESCDLSEPTA